MIEQDPDQASTLKSHCYVAGDYSSNLVGHLGFQVAGHLHC